MKQRSKVKRGETEGEASAGTETGVVQSSWESGPAVLRAALDGAVWK